MTGFLAALALMAALTLLARRWVSFAAQRPTDYAQGATQLDIRQHLDGPMLCEGVIHGPTGRVTSRFVATMRGRWEGNAGTLDETFRYSSGEVQHRQWRLSLGNDGRVRAEADDLIRPGEGCQQGDALRLRYRIRLPAHAGGWALDVTDWMYLCDNGTIMNRSQFRKFGLPVAELVATMRKVAP